LLFAAKLAGGNWSGGKELVVSALDGSDTVLRIADAFDLEGDVPPV
jgi:hypothetical protein